MIKLTRFAKSASMNKTLQESKDRETEKIETRHDPKPIPVRRFDWEATHSDFYEEGDPIGYGKTKEEAIEDLINQLRGGEYPGFEYDDEDNTPRDIPGFEGTRDDLDNLSIREIKLTRFAKSASMNKTLQESKDREIDIVKSNVQYGVNRPTITITKDYILTKVKSEHVEDPSRILGQDPGNDVLAVTYESDELPGYQFRTFFIENVNYPPVPITLRKNEKGGYGWEVFYNGRQIKLLHTGEVYGSVSKNNKKQQTMENQKLNESKNFNLRKFLTENKLTSNSRLLNEERVKVINDNFPYIEFTDGSKNYQVEFDYYDEIDDHGYQLDVLYVGEDQFGDEWSIEVIQDRMSGDVDEYDLSSIQRE